MKRKTYNWKPVLGSLLKTLQDHGFTLASVDNGDGRESITGTSREQRQQAKALIDATDESHLYVIYQSRSRELRIYIVLGNEPEETVADYTVFDPLEAPLEEFFKRWEGKPCPTK